MEIEQKWYMFVFLIAVAPLHRDLSIYFIYLTEYLLTGIDNRSENENSS